MNEYNMIIFSDILPPMMDSYLAYGCINSNLYNPLSLFNNKNNKPHNTIYFIKINPLINIITKMIIKLYIISQSVFY